MTINQTFRIGTFLCLVTLFIGAAGAQEIAKVVDPNIEGKWVSKEKTKSGAVKLVKEHANGKTTLTAFDAANQIVYAKTSEYHTERHGNVMLLVFKNSKFTAGPDAGKTDNRTRSYVYRVEGQKFYEVRGMVIGVDEPVNIVVWEREVVPPA